MDGRWKGSRPDMPQRLGRWAGRVTEGGRSSRVVGLAGAGVAVVLVVAITVAMLTSAGDDGQGAASAAVESSLTVDPSTAPATTPSASPSPSPSKSKKPAPDPTEDGQGGEEKEEPEPDPTTKKPKGTVSTGPTSFDVWRTGEGKYAANWEWPVSDGGLRISGYVLRECGGKEIIRVNDATYAIEFNYPYLECATVQAINAAGEGAKSTGHVPNP